MGRREQGKASRAQGFAQGQGEGGPDSQTRRSAAGHSLSSSLQKVDFHKKISLMDRKKM